MTEECSARRIASDWREESIPVRNGLACFADVLRGEESIHSRRCGLECSVRGTEWSEEKLSAEKGNSGDGDKNDQTSNWRARLVGDTKKGQGKLG